MEKVNLKLIDGVQSATDLNEDEVAPAFSEEEFALQFAARHARDLRYVAAWGRWLHWVGNRWRFDDTREPFTLARKLCREAAARANKNEKAIASARTRAAVVSLASEDRRLKATIDQWDANLWLLNTPDGVIDLRTGKRRACSPEDYMTKMTAVGPDESCPTPLWSKFVTRVTADPDLAAFLARISGYALTGSTREHALFFLYGLGANGKGVFMNAITGIMGDYQRAAPIETFTASNVDRHPTELAMLRGARLVTAVETEEGRRWAESRIKMLTGGDPISARFMRQDFFEYTPQFKLIIAGNHKPGLRSVDEAIRRRFHLIPFEITIPPNERDKDLGEKLKAEWPGILAWMIKGCARWQKIGLAPPGKVINATDEYLQEEDAIKLWLDERCELKASDWTPVGALYESFAGFARAAGEYVVSSKRFSQRLEALGLKPLRRDQRGFAGIGIRPRHEKPL